MLRKISKKLLLSTTVSSFLLGISVSATNITPVPGSSHDDEGVLLKSPSTPVSEKQKINNSIDLNGMASLFLLSFKDLTEERVNKVIDVITKFGLRKLSIFEIIRFFQLSDENLSEEHVNKVNNIIKNSNLMMPSFSQVVYLLKLSDKELSAENMSLNVKSTEQPDPNESVLYNSPDRLHKHLPESSHGKELSKDHISLVKKVVDKSGPGNLGPDELVKLLSLSDEELKKMLGEDSQVDEDFDSYQITTLEESAQMF